MRNCSATSSRNGCIVTSARTEPAGSTRPEGEEQRDRIQELTFSSKHIDLDAIPSRPLATASLGILRASICNFNDRLFTSPINSDVIISEVANVLRMQLARLDTWEWPDGKKGVFVEMRRHLSGKYRAYMDNEIVQVLLFQYIGMKWSMALKEAFRLVVKSNAWKTGVEGTHPLTRDHIIRRQYFGLENGPSFTAETIQAHRRRIQLDQFFMTQLLDYSWCFCAAGVAEVDQCRCILEEGFVWEFGLKWLAAKLRFENSSEVMVRQRGVPIAHALSVICGEALLFVVDFAVNQRAQGLYIYRIYDDFWLTSHSSSI
ncbi:hypothetical protein D9757_009107 [Collybiopsis confluens]|uniref:Reverse transcriptase n=1 Tax=Collybiopsis confluens TaxID=2823264 RepID=A0A8H5M302_9AGAR|nr:hypothetical protein D9757_009107 [Collybiopsis confluens]